MKSKNVKDMKKGLKVSTAALMGAVMMSTSGCLYAMKPGDEDKLISQSHVEISDQGSGDANLIDERADIDTGSQSEQAGPQFEFIYGNDGMRSLSCYERGSIWEIYLNDNECATMQSCIFDVSGSFDCKSFLKEAAKLVESDEAFSLKDFVNSHSNLSLKEVYVRGKGRIKCDKDYDSSWVFSLMNDDFEITQSCIFDASEEFDRKSFLSEAVDRLVESGEAFSLEGFVSLKPNLTLFQCFRSKQDQELSAQYDSEKMSADSTQKETKSGKIFSENGITYRIGFGKKVSVIGIDKSLETVDIKKYIDYDGVKYEVVAINPEYDYYVLNDSNVKVINLPEEGIDIENCTFSGARQLTTVKNFDKVNMSSSESFFYGCESLSEVRLPETLKMIGMKMFLGCHCLRNIDISKNVEIIGYNSFFDCCNLETVNFAEGSNLKKIEDAAFSCCKSLKYLDLPESVSIAGSVFKGAEQLITVNNLNKANILSSNFLFSGCMSLSEINLPETLEEIGEQMLYNCHSLRTITIGENVANIGYESFLGCLKLDSVNFQEKSQLASIEQGAFCGCKQLKACMIPASVQEICDYAFVGCESLNPVKLDSTVKVGLYGFPEGKVIGPEIKRDEKLEAQNKIIEAFISRILEGEKSKGRDINRQVSKEDIDKLFYEYTPRSTDKPRVVSREEFEKITKDGRLVFYKGVTRPEDCKHMALSADVRFPTAISVSKNFKYGDFYYPVECEGIHCARQVEYARRYANGEICSGSFIAEKGVVLGFCFTDVSPDEFKMMSVSDFSRIEIFYKYFHDLSLRFITNKEKVILEHDLRSLIVSDGKHSFIARALGCDVIEDVGYNEFRIFNRGKLTVCAEDF